MSISTTYPTDKLSLFFDIPATDRTRLLAGAKIRYLKKNEHLFHHGDPCSTFFIVAEGAVHLHRQTPEGRDITLHIAIIGDTLGEEEMLANKVLYQADAVAAENCTLLEYPTEWMRQQLQTNHTLALNLLTAISKRGSRALMDREQMVTLKTPQRIGCFLMQLCSMYQFDPKKFTLPYSKSTIASKLGMEPESFSRALSKLKEVGVTVEGMHVCIHDLNVLNQYVCATCSISEDCENCSNIKRPA